MHAHSGGRGGRRSGDNSIVSSTQHHHQAYQHQQQQQQQGKSKDCWLSVQHNTARRYCFMAITGCYTSSQHSQGAALYDRPTAVYSQWNSSFLQHDAMHMHVSAVYPLWCGPMRVRRKPVQQSVCAAVLVTVQLSTSIINWQSSSNVSLIRPDDTHTWLTIIFITRNTSQGLACSPPSLAVLALPIRGETIQIIDRSLVNSLRLLSSPHFYHAT